MPLMLAKSQKLVVMKMVIALCGVHVKIVMTGMINMTVDWHA
jgi:hypothetical protein